MNKVIMAIALLAVVYCGSLNLSESMHHTILDSYIEKGDTKTLFKVWHFIFNKQNDYDINTETGIKKYKVFKQNLALIKEHNAKNLSWKEGLNDFSDMTEKETDEFLGIRDKTPEEINEMIQTVTGKKFDFDYYADLDDKTDPNPNPNPQLKERVPIDWEANLSPIRNQGGCGSCYSFSTLAAVEGNWSIKNNGQHIDLAPQQIVDCSPKTKGCNGGWMGNVLNYIRDNGIEEEKNYKYNARPGKCEHNSNKSSTVRVTGYNVAGSYWEPLPDDVYNLLLKGPLTNCVDTAGIHRYRSGIINKPCTQRCPHAVNTIGYGIDESTGLPYIRMRNSWGTSWGEKGYARVKQDWSNGFTCMLEFPGWTLKPVVE